MAVTSQFFGMTSSSKKFWHCFVSLVKFSYCSKFHVSIIHWFCSYDNFFLLGIDQKFRNQKYPHLSFAQYLETGESKEFGKNGSNKMLLLNTESTQIRVNMWSCLIRWQTKNIIFIIIILMTTKLGKVVTPWRAPTHKGTWSLNCMLLCGHMTLNTLYLHLL